MPIQPPGAEGIKGTVEIKEEFSEGLQDLERFSHVILFYHFHKSEGYSLTVIPFLDNEPHGLFTTRAPRRPNGIGMSVVKLTGIENNILQIENVDILDGTPLLDIKPYVPDFDTRRPERIGWLSKKSSDARQRRSNGRFSLG